MPNPPKFIQKNIVINTHLPSIDDKKNLLLLLEEFNQHYFFFRDGQDKPSVYQVNRTIKKRSLFLFKNTTYQISYNFRLTNTLLKYRRRKDPSQERWAVLGGEIGNGAQGSVYQIIATVYIHHHSVIVKNKSTCIVKLMQPSFISLNDTITENNADHEYNMMNRLAFIYHPRKAIHDNANNLDALISQRFGHCDLHSLLFENKLIDKFSISEKIELCRSLLIELKKIHDAGITHRDIKPDNILIEFTSLNTVSSVRIIDLGLAKESAITSTTIKQPGTHMYKSPELFATNSANNPADIFAMGRVFWMIFCNYQPIFAYLEHPMLPRLTVNGYMPSLMELFRESTLDKELQIKLYALFLTMNINNPQKRATIPLCLEQLDALYLMANSVTSTHTANPHSLFFKATPLPTEINKELTSSPA